MLESEEEIKLFSNEVYHFFQVSLARNFWEWGKLVLPVRKGVQWNSLTLSQPEHPDESAAALMLTPFALTLKSVAEGTRLHSKAQNLAQDSLKCNWIWIFQAAWKSKLGKWWSGSLFKQILETEGEVRGIVRNNLWHGSGRSSSVSLSVPKGTTLLGDAMQSYY